MADGWFTRLRAGLARSSDRLTQAIGKIATERKLDDASLEELEDALIAGDLGVATAAELVSGFAGKRFRRDVTDAEIRETLAQRIATILSPVARPLEPVAGRRPHVVLFMGVNGSGKTTTIGKLAALHADAGRKVVLAACDTFRAAASEQLAIWGARSGCEVVAGKPGDDAAGLAYRAFEAARAARADLLLVDTAGRLHNKNTLMEELAKIVRVLGKFDTSAPHDSILVLDATIGQNSLAQVETFRESCGVTGLVVTKLDGSARGGVVVSLASRFGLPIHAVGVGEGKEDLRPFDAAQFARSLMGLHASRS